MNAEREFVLWSKPRDYLAVSSKSRVPLRLPGYDPLAAREVQQREQSGQIGHAVEERHIQQLQLADGPGPIEIARHGGGVEQRLPGGERGVRGVREAREQTGNEQQQQCYGRQTS